MIPFKPMPQYLLTQYFYVFVIIASTAVCLPHTTSPGELTELTAQPTSSGFVFDNTTIPSLCPSEDGEGCIVFTSKPPSPLTQTTTINATTNAIPSTADSSKATAATVYPPVIPTDLGSLKNITFTNTTDIGRATPHGSTPTDPQEQTPTRPHQRTAPAIGPGFFYVGRGMSIRCRNRHHVMQNIISMFKNNELPAPNPFIWTVSRELWAQKMNSARKTLQIDKPMDGRIYSRGVSYVGLYQRRCTEQCLCSQRGHIGRFREDREFNWNNPGWTNFGLRWNPLEGPQARDCREDYQAARCFYLWGCFCHAVLSERTRPGPELNGLSLEDFANAIDRIPPIVRNFEQNQDWAGWFPDDSRAQFPGQRIGFSRDHSVYPSRPLDNGILTPEQLAQLQREQLPAMYEGDGRRVFTPEGGPLAEDPFVDMEEYYASFARLPNARGNGGGSRRDGGFFERPDGPPPPFSGSGGV
ncbi:hypothetical protein TWF718_010373 [Orbilia javanica]|uniref:Uncharacterized protein n=1 Tax=Orbilia javanica TaxID=47235 RepID=A0AAN8RA06_9PEZI